MPNCKYCGGAIVNKRSDAFYCSSTCSATAEKRRHRERKGLTVNEQRGPYKIERKVYQTKREYLRVYSRDKYRKDMPEGGRLADARRDGFRSGFERTLANQLKMAGVPFEYETLKLPYTINFTYKPDVILENGIIIEIKGVLNKRDNMETRKMIAVKNQHPDLDIRFVFSDADQPIPRMKMTHGKWAEKYGFPYASKTIPTEWYKQ